MNQEFIESECQSKKIRELQENSRKIRSFERMFWEDKLIKFAINHEYCSRCLLQMMKCFFPPVTGG